MVNMKENTPRKSSGFILTLLFFVFYPAGVYRVCKKGFRPAWLKWMYSIIGLPVFILVYTFLGIILFASFLPELDRTIGVRSDRTITNVADKYTVTFLKTSKETNGAYEEVKVEL